MTPRAAAMSATDRRDALVAAVLPLLREHGRGVTTRQIAAAAGVAEGTIFRAFPSKDELIDAALSQAFVTSTFARDLMAVDVSVPLRERLVDMVTVLQNRLTDMFDLMAAVGMVGPPDHDSEVHVRARAEVNQVLEMLLTPDAHRLRLPIADVLHFLRLLTFAGSHHRIADGWLLTPPQIVDLVLDGVLRKDA